MKRKAVLTALVLIIAMLAAQVIFASDALISPNPSAGLQVIKTVPEDGETGKQVSNMAVKIVFNEDVSTEKNDTINTYCINITDPDGNKQAFEIVHHPKAPNELWCILKNNLEANTEYTVTVGTGTRATSDNTISVPYTFTFKTRNTKVDSTISIFLTFGMMGIMIFATTRAQKKQEDTNNAKSKNAASEKKTQTDPYRLAKEKGISVDEAKAQIAKEKGKLDKKKASTQKAREKYEAEMAAKEAEIERRLKEIHDASVYKVKAKGSLKDHGGVIPKAILKKQAARRKSRKK